MVERFFEPIPLDTKWNLSRHQKFFYDVRWNLISLAFINRYPHPHARHVHSSDFLSCQVDEKGILRITKLYKKNRTLSMRQLFMFERFKDVMVLETIEVDRNEGTTKSVSWNLNYLNEGQIIDRHNFYKDNLYDSRMYCDQNTNHNSEYLVKAITSYFLTAFQKTRIERPLKLKSERYRDFLPFEEI